MKELPTFIVDAVGCFLVQAVFAQVALVVVVDVLLLLLLLLLVVAVVGGGG